jgi:hypothetical protein
MRTRGAWLLLLGLLAYTAHGASLRTDSGEENAFALGYRFTALYESYRVRIKVTSPSGREGLRKSVRKKLDEHVQPYADHLGMDLTLSELVINGLERAKSMRDYNTMLGRVRRHVLSARARLCYDLGRNLALILVAADYAQKVGENDFFGMVRTNVVNGTAQPERTRGQFIEYGMLVNTCLEDLKFTSKRLDLSTTDLDHALKNLDAILVLCNAHYATGFERPGELLNSPESGKSKNGNE